MNFIVSANTDIGISKNTNQDSLTVKVLQTAQGKMVFALLCDGMGGLAKGEVASASVIRAFDDWVRNALPSMSAHPLEEATLRDAWNAILVGQNEKIQAFGSRLGIRLGTTAVVMLLTQTSYFVMNVGDSRAYEITDRVRVITKDQTFVAREVELGNMTEEQANTDPRRSVLLQCVGASAQVYPDMFSGPVAPNATYMLCSDGFRHEISPEEICAAFRPEALPDEGAMTRNTLSLIELNKQRQERDNISVALVRVF